MESHILDIDTLSDLMHHNARRLLSAEKQLENIFPQWIGETKFSSLATALNNYLSLVSGNIKDLRQYLDKEGIGTLSCTNRMMQDIILELRETMSNCTNAGVKQATLLATVQTICHYKTAMYNHLATCAAIIGNPDAVRFFLRARLREEDMGKILAEMATNAIIASSCK